RRTTPRASGCSRAACAGCGPGKACACRTWAGTACARCAGIHCWPASPGATTPISCTVTPPTSPPIASPAPATAPSSGPGLGVSMRCRASSIPSVRPGPARGSWPPSCRWTLDMDSFSLYPALDVRGARIVRLAQGDYAQETRYGDDPLALAREYAAQGARWLHLVDLDAARSGGYTLATLVGRIAGEAGLQVQTGGGVRSREDVQRILDAGAARVV